ncbi:hypothetical protein P171DRAFT_525686 [Karstenula rhodostoma CBS 690.94]|uniref:MADS-box domain-containing protein n=1 Tax=Karstenula rhodostoma CBS 690.94 TaxID=1392251 RepID=A0A9P4P686_9PLEO|nr:hypothetical protein P171DRAFT_525686 [Karstenula rhodostoma CBS 690.94]
MSSLTRNSAMFRDKFFCRRRKGLDIKAKALVLQDQDVKVAIFYSHGNELSVFRSHPHLPDWPFAGSSLVDAPIHETCMDSYPTDSKQMEWLTEWFRREGLTNPWPQTQMAQPTAHSPSVFFGGETGAQNGNDVRMQMLPRQQPGILVDLNQAGTALEEEPGYSSIPDLMPPEWFGPLQDARSPIRPQSVSQPTPAAMQPAQKDPANSEEELTDEDFVNLGSENRYRGGESETDVNSPHKRGRGNNGQYLHQLDHAVADQHPRSTATNSPARTRHTHLHRARTHYMLPSEGREHLRTEYRVPIFEGRSGVHGNPPLTRARAAQYH